MYAYKLGNKDIFNAITTTKGTQPKYFKDNYYYKQNKNGNEGFVEYLVSRLLTYSTVTCSRHLTKNHPLDNFLQEVGASCSSQTILTVSTGYPREPHG